MVLQIILPPGTNVPESYGSGSDEDQVLYLSASILIPHPVLLSLFDISFNHSSLLCLISLCNQLFMAFFEIAVDSVLSLLACDQFIFLM